jgi:hypothetical protein
MTGAVAVPRVKLDVPHGNEPSSAWVIAKA